MHFELQIGSIRLQLRLPTGPHIAALGTVVNARSSISSSSWFSPRSGCEAAWKGMSHPWQFYAKISGACLLVSYLLLGCCKYNCALRLS